MLDPQRRIEGTDGLTVLDFWRWAYSDVLSNRNRAVLAEFLVGSALGACSTARVDWDVVDFRYRGRAIEVKASGFVQGWPTLKRPVPRYSIAKRRPWDMRTNRWGPDVIRSADCYVFCLHAEHERSAADPLDTAQWRFFVVAREEIDREFGDRQLVTLPVLEQLTGAVGFDALRGRVDEVLEMAGSGDGV